MKTTQNNVTDQVARLAEKSLAEHQLEQRSTNGLFRSWRCMMPDSWNYGFDVTTTPGWIFLYGDIGHLALCRDEDMLPWVRGRFGGSSIDFRYIAEKSPQEIITRKWDQDAAIRQLDEHLADVEIDDYEKRLEYMDSARACEDQCEWLDLCRDLCSDGVCDMPPDGTDWAPGFLWCVFGLKRFIELLDEATHVKAVE